MARTLLNGTGNLEETITSDDILGKEVIDVEGETIGVVEKIFIDSKSLEFIGISVDKGFLKKGLIIGKDYIRKVTSYAVFLNIRPSFLLKGMLVFDKNGRKIGTVVQMEQRGQSNYIKHIAVRRMKDTINIPRTCIETIGYSVILNVEDKDLEILPQ